MVKAADTSASTVFSTSAATWIRCPGWLEVIEMV